MTFKIRLDIKKLDDIIRTNPAKASEIVRSAAFAVEGQAKVRAPVDTGALINSIQAQERGPFLWHVSDGVEYGVYQELGFHHHGSGSFIQNPFMVPAVESVSRQFIANWRKLIE